MPIELEETALPTSTPADATATAAPRAPRATEPGGQLEPGRRLAHFRIDKLLGAGGMGEVYLATDLALDRPVAIKVLPAGGRARPEPARAADPRGARAGAVDHPNVGHIYFIGEEDGRLFFAMEYVAGETLAERVARGPLPVDDALAVIRARGARPARGAALRGFTHRDVKPSNLMVDAHGVVKVARLRARRRRAARRPTPTGAGRADRRSPARRSTWRPSRRAASRSTSAPTSTRSARRCITWSRASRRSRRDASTSSLTLHATRDAPRAAAPRRAAHADRARSTRCARG